MKAQNQGRAAPEQLRHFCTEIYPRVFGSLCVYTGDRHAAEDLTQETFIRVCRDWEKVQSLPNPTAWAHTVAFNLAKSRFRRKAARRRAEDKTRSRAMTTTASRASMPDAADVMAIRTAVKQLNPEMRAVIALRYFAGLSIAETAESLDVPEGTVKSRARRAITELRSHGLILDEPTDDDTDITVRRPIGRTETSPQAWIQEGSSS